MFIYYKTRSFEKLLTSKRVHIYFSFGLYVDATKEDELSVLLPSVWNQIYKMQLFPLQ
jgi:hypothetical protein